MNDTARAPDGRRWRALLPAWLLQYRRDLLGGDLTAGLIVTVMVIPQSLAYAMLAGLPPQAGLYASILPLVAYACFGTSMTLAVGPVAVVSLMTASALQPLAGTGTAEYLTLAILLALLSGVMTFAFGLLRLGTLAHFLSHPVISGFITGSALLISINQLQPLLGIEGRFDGALGTAIGVATHLHLADIATATLGIGSLLILWFARDRLPALLQRLGLPEARAGLLAKLAPMAVVIGATLLVGMLQLHRSAGVDVVGAVPSGLPVLQLPIPGLDALRALWLPALLISLVGFVESVSVAQSLAHRRRQRIDVNRELLGLGAANVASAVSGGYPVTGSFARSLANFSAGANTPFAGVISAGLMTVVVFGLTDWFELLPKAVLAATIIVAVIGLIDIGAIRQTWRYDRADGFALLATAAGVLLLGVDAGIVTGVALSLATLVWRSSHPHLAIVGRVPGTEHFRNVERHAVQTVPGVLAVRIDENLFFGNASAVEGRLAQILGDHPQTRHLLLILSAVNRIDSTALDMLTDLEHTLGARGIELSLAEVKGPVMDALRPTRFGQLLAQRIWLSAHEAVTHLQSRRDEYS